MPVEILRLGHRIFRDKRITTHLFLTARAFGSKNGYYSGEADSRLEETVKKASETWGGKFSLIHTASPKALVSGFSGKIVHLTVYGVPVGREIGKIRKHRNLLVIVGGEKVPREFYQAADWNISIGSQPHSEISSLAIFLDRYFSGRQLSKKFSNARLEIIGQPMGKKVVRHGKED